MGKTLQHCESSLDGLQYSVKTQQSVLKELKSTLHQVASSGSRKYYDSQSQVLQMVRAAVNSQPETTASVGSIRKDLRDVRERLIGLYATQVEHLERHTYCM